MNMPENRPKFQESFPRPVEGETSMDHPDADGGTAAAKKFLEGSAVEDELARARRLNAEGRLAERLRNKRAAGEKPT